MGRGLALVPSPGWELTGGSLFPYTPSTNVHGFVMAEPVLWGIWP